jgi:5-deoxy-D-glucuronate isomerase
VGAYTDRDLDAMLAVKDEEVVSYPRPLFGHRPYFGHAGARDWWAAMMASTRRCDLVMREVRHASDGWQFSERYTAPRAGGHLAPGQ